MILIFYIWISVWIIQATATALVQALRDRRLEDTTKSEFVIKISLKSSIALTLRLEPFLAGGHRASWVLRESGKEKWSICAATKGFLLCARNYFIIVARGGGACRQSTVFRVNWSFWKERSVPGPLCIQLSPIRSEDLKPSRPPQLFPNLAYQHWCGFQPGYWSHICSLVSILVKATQPSSALMNHALRE